MFKPKIDEHPELFDNVKDIANRKELCTYIGDFFEEAASKLFNAERLRNARYMDVNPDLANSERTVFYESKASNTDSGGAPIKIEQFKCYLDFVDLYFPDFHSDTPTFKVEVYYLIWFYNLAKLDYKNHFKLYRDLAKCDKHLYVLRLDAVRTMIKYQDHQINIRLRKKAIEDFASKIDDQYITELVSTPVEVYGQQMADVLITKIV